MNTRDGDWRNKSSAAFDCVLCVLETSRPQPGEVTRRMVVDAALASDVRTRRHEEPSL